MPADRVLPEPSGCRLAELAALVPEAQLLVGSDGGDPLITTVTHDSRRVQPGGLYAALPGANTHGARFAGQAAEAGAAAVLTDPAGAGMIQDARLDLPLLVVDNPRAELGAISAAVYGHPAERLLIFAVTGTNGKTTTTYLLHNVLTAFGHRAGLIGTIETRIGTEHVRSVRTTPESPDLQELFAHMVSSGADSCAMEVSSHALALHRVDAVVADIAGFTNLSQDHLDFHGTIEDYYAAKLALFTPEHSSAAVVCVDDEWGRRVAREATVPVTTLRTRPAGVRGPVAGGEQVGGEQPSPSTGKVPDWCVSRCTPDPDGPGMRLTLTHRSGMQWHLVSPLPGDFNVANTALAAVMLLRAGFDPDEIAAGLVDAPGVPGRMQVVAAEQRDRDQSQTDQSQPLGVVDYAHSPESIATALAALRHSGSGPIVIVLGAGGDRDRGKRRMMGAAAVAGADAVIVTDDNPRSEVPAEIRAEVLAGARAAHAEHHDVQIEEVQDRRQAVRRGLDLLTGLVANATHSPPGSTAHGHQQRPTLLLAGKGHETGQEIAGEVHPFDDRLVLAEALTALSASTSPASTSHPAERTS